MICTNLALLLLVGNALWLQPAELGSPLKRQLDAVIENYRVSEPDLARALIAVASQFQVPMGIEWIQSGSRHPVSLRWKTGTVRQILESVVKSQPGYKLEVGENMLHVFYDGAKADPGNFLNIRITEVTLQRTPVAVARRRLQQIVWNKALPPSAHPPGKPISEGGEVILDPDDKPQNFRWENVTVRDALDETTLAGHYKVWAVSFPDDPARTATGFRPTLSLWTPWVDPNNLPSFDLFDWRHRPPLPVEKSNK